MRILGRRSVLLILQGSSDHDEDDVEDDAEDDVEDDAEDDAAFISGFKPETT